MLVLLALLLYVPQCSFSPTRSLTVESVLPVLFADTFKLSFENGNPMNWSRAKISWKEDREDKFKNPSGDLAVAFNATSKPVYWPQSAAELDVANPNNNGFVNEDFLVWMRTSALPKFRKLYAHNSGGLKKGSYSLAIKYSILLGFPFVCLLL